MCQGPACLDTALPRQLSLPHSYWPARGHTHADKHVTALFSQTTRLCIAWSLFWPPAPRGSDLSALVILGLHWVSSAAPSHAGLQFIYASLLSAPPLFCFRCPFSQPWFTPFLHFLLCSSLFTTVLPFFFNNADGRTNRHWLPASLKRWRAIIHFRLSAKRLN